jgi:hypothetical protein
MVDIDGDGDYDQALYFRTRKIGIAYGDAEAILIGKTFSGLPIQDL